MDKTNRRRHQRIKCDYCIKFCREGDHWNWDIAPIRNISEGGILFYASNNYEHGSQLDMTIYHFHSNPDKICKGTVIRCDKIDKREGLYEVVVDISQLDENTKNALYKNMEQRL